MFSSLRWRIAIPYVLLILAVMFGLGLRLSNEARRRGFDELEQRLIAEAGVLAGFLAGAPAEDLSPQKVDPLAKAWAEQLGVRVTIVAADGTVLGESHEDRTRMENHLDRPEIRQAMEAGSGKSLRFSQTVGAEMMYVAVTAAGKGESPGFVRLAVSLDQVQDQAASVQRYILAGTLAASLLAVLLAIALAHFLARPLSRLAEAARQMALGEAGNLPLPTAPEEVGRLSQAFETMRAQLRDQFRALEAERSKLAAVLDQLADAVLIVDADGKVRSMNPAAQKMFSLQEGEVIGRSLAGVVRQHQLVELWRACRKSNESQAATLELPTRRQFIQGVAIPLKQVLSGNTLLVLQDLTHLRHLETVRRDFVSNISHELRTPLASLKALVETLLESALEDPPAARRFLARMESELDALALVVQELLELSRIESGSVALQLRPIQAGELLAEAAERLRLQAERADLDLEVRVEEDLPAALADPGRVQQVVNNLLHNAIKFTPPGGRIILSATREGGSIVFSVQDSGVGIPAEELERIFERFYKADRSRSGGGAGLGLAIARHLVEAHGGRIWVESVEGQGSAFFFSIPLERSGPNPPP